MNETIVIAIDGTAACGKGTLAKRFAAHYGFAHLDSGALYRLVARGVVEAGGDPADREHAISVARALDITRAHEPAIRSDAIGRDASHITRPST